jgi:hypothetical protein
MAACGSQASIFDDFAIGRDPSFELSHHVCQLRQSSAVRIMAQQSTVTFSVA